MGISELVIEKGHGGIGSNGERPTKALTTPTGRPLSKEEEPAIRSWA